MTLILALEMSQERLAKPWAGACRGLPSVSRAMGRNEPQSEVSGSKTGGNEMNYVLLEGIVADVLGLL